MLVMLIQSPILVPIRTTIIDTWSKSNNPNAPKEAESLLMEMIDLFSKGKLEDGPNATLYSAVINYWSISNRPEAAIRALEILERMIAKYKFTYSSVMDTFAKQGDDDGANRVFTMMKEDYKSGNIDSKPNIATYRILIDARNNYSGSQNARFDIEKSLN